MSLQTRLKKMEAVAFPPEPEKIWVRVMHYGDGPLPEEIEHLERDGKGVIIRQIVVSPERYASQ